MSISNKNFFELCNDILDELYYEQVDSFDELDNLTEGRRVKKELNRALVMICNNENTNWEFKETRTPIITVAGQANYKMPNGFIRYLKKDKQNLVLSYVNDYKYYPLDTTGSPVQYWIHDNTIRLFPIPSGEEEIMVRIMTNDCARDCNGILKAQMECECDVPIIPNKHRNILIYRVCADWRANDGDAKSQYYDRKYREAYRAMKMDCIQTKDYPSGLDIMGGIPSITQTLYNAWDISTQTSRGQM